MQGYFYTTQTLEKIAGFYEKVFGATLPVVLSYIFKEIFHQGVCFLERWYLRRSAWFWAKVVDLLQLLDKRLAVLINFRMLFQPLYGDYSLAGRVLGPVFRLWRIVFGGILYLALLLLAGAVWFLYTLAIPAILLGIFNT